MTSVFLSYRRRDAAGHAGRLYDRLVARFGRDSVFMDLDSIGPGVDWVERIEQAVDASDVMLAVIGRNWLDEAKPDGARRLDDPRDVVRTEIAAALARRLTVVPVLVQGAQMPAPEDLPADLAALSRRNAVELADAGWRSDVERLLDSISEIASRPRSARAGGELSPGAGTGGYRLEQAGAGAAATEASGRPDRRKPALVRFRQLSSWGAPLRVAAPLGAAVIAVAVVVSGEALSGGSRQGGSSKPGSPAAPLTSPGSGSPAAPSAPAVPAPKEQFSFHRGRRRCSPGPALSGQLVVTGVSCPSARRITLAYFTHTGGGRRLASGQVGQFRCQGQTRGNAFAISCRHGPALTSFVGVPTGH